MDPDQWASEEASLFVSTMFSILEYFFIIISKEFIKFQHNKD